MTVILCLYELLYLAENRKDMTDWKCFIRFNNVIGESLSA